MRMVAVVPHWNHSDLLSALLESLAAQQRPFDEVIVVDNGSTDDSAQVAQRFRARFIELDRNFGFAHAVNRGVQAAEADWIAILNNDVTLDPAWLAHLIDASGDRAWF